MSKIKKLIVLATACVMLVGGTLIVHAANDWTICNGMGGVCQKKMTPVIATGAPCVYPGCYSTVYFYRCPDYEIGGFHAERAACTSGHLN